MSQSETFEDAILDQYEPRWKADGYEIIRYPSKNDMPAFLGSYRPDAIARGRKPSLVIEVVRKGNSIAQKRVQELRKLILDHSDWRLEVIYAGESESEVVPVSADAIENALHSSEELASHDTRASLLIAWATLEALVRRLVPQEATKPQTPGRVVELLAGAGYILPSQAEELRKLATMRNRLVHGDLDVQPTGNEVQILTAAIEELIEVLRHKNVA